ncbi:E3 ubiquitin-protein ligase SINAT2-like [Folsomia candida]|uniref:E3 ubiquitin-protein ligase sina n=1 Tax=Folsomia candida TaxID=158441 RepID=A0A226DN68_FOLCA|nr:E3 ubiquitin-protein ligase SINAT2-like [Folsomia candida]OXA46639.1 E3 ubiquitin-protein ligase sina [Folsomia candida]
MMTNSSATPTTTADCNTTTTMTTPVNLPPSGRGDGDNAVPIWTSTPPTPSTPRVQFTGTEIDDHLDKLLECPVCYDVILPPIISCCRGHSCCETCRASVHKCPICRGEFSNVRNLFAEQFLEKCQFKCKHGCTVCLPAKDLTTHYQTECYFRPILCRECDRMIPFDDFLQHIELVDKLERQKASECSTGFEIDEADLAANPVSPVGRRVTVWEPTWMHCYGEDYFCSLDFNGEHWWIWVSSLNESGKKHKSQIILWSKQKESEHTYFGTIHSIRTKPDDVLQSGECLILTEKTVKNFMYSGGIDVLVRIEQKYVVPKTRRGVDVQSPLEIMKSPSSRTQRLRTTGQQSSNPTSDRDDQLVTPTRSTFRPSSLRSESRIPILNPPQTGITAGGETSDDDGTTSNTARRVLFNDITTIPSRGAGVSGTAGDMRFRIGRGYRHRYQLRSQPETVTIPEE